VVENHPALLAHICCAVFCEVVTEIVNGASINAPARTIVTAPSLSGRHTDNLIPEPVYLIQKENFQIRHHFCSVPLQGTGSKKIKE
jgi:hypothetical protein